NFLISTGLIMSDLQLGLILLGVVLILLVLLFNWWQDRRVRKQMQERFPEREDDPLLGKHAPTSAGRREPGLGTLVPPTVGSSADGDDADEVDPTTEVVIDIAFAQAVPGEELQSAVYPAVHL